jgi:DNA-binding NarL/FixJ family response regulator
LKRHCPDVKAVMLSAYVRDHYLDEAYRTGAWGYLLKSSSPEEVLEGIRKVARGEPAFSEEVERRFQSRPAVRGDVAVPSKLGLLSSREQQILRMIARGLSRTAIAEQLSRSPMTVDNHRKSIMKKLGINDRADLVRYAIAEKLVEL